jgi:hypothetical protein
LGTLGVLVGDVWQFDCGGHDVDYLDSLAEEDRSKVVFPQKGVVDIRARADVLAYALVACWLA